MSHLHYAYCKIDAKVLDSISIYRNVNYILNLNCHKQKQLQLQKWTVSTSVFPNPLFSMYVLVPCKIGETESLSMPARSLMHIVIQHLSQLLLHTMHAPAKLPERSSLDMHWCYICPWGTLNDLELLNNEQ